MLQEMTLSLSVNMMSYFNTVITKQHHFKITKVFAARILFFVFHGVIRLVTPLSEIQEMQNSH